MRLPLGNKHHLSKSADRKAQNQEGVRSAHRTDLCFSICRFSQVVFIPQAQPHAQSLFLFPIVFGINIMLLGLCRDCDSTSKLVVRMLLSTLCLSPAQTCSSHFAQLVWLVYHLQGKSRDQGDALTLWLDFPLTSSMFS